MKTVLFDLDGTLLDTETSILGAFHHAFTAYDVAEPAVEEIKARMGMSLRDMYRLFAPQHDLEQLVEAHRTFQNDNLHLVAPFTDAKNTVATLQKHGFKLGIVTSRLRASSHTYLSQAGLTDFFGTIVTGDDVIHHKPHPEPVFAALRELGAHPIDTFFVGDTSADIGAGKAASVTTVAALYGQGGPSIRALEPDHTIEKIADILSIVLR